MSESTGAETLEDAFRPCPNCGKPVDRRKRLCHHCGALMETAPEVAPSPDTATPPPSGSGGRKRSVALQIVKAILGVCCTLVGLLGLAALGLYVICSQPNQTWNPSGHGVDVVILLVLASVTFLAFVAAWFALRRPPNK